MTREEKAKYLTGFFDRLRHLKKLQDAASVLLGFDGKLAEATHRIEADAIKGVELRVGDFGESVSWFIYENEFGARGMEAKATEWPAPRAIKTVTDLLDLIAPAPDLLPAYEEHTLHFAMRYALGRRSTAPSIVAGQIKGKWSRIRPSTRAQMKLEIREAIDAGLAGDACDIATWQTIEALPQ